MNEEYIEFIEGNIYDNTYSALELLLINCRSIQKQFKSSPVDMSTSSYIRELCTVRMAASRRSGHSSSIVKLALQYFNQAIFISPTYLMRDDLRRIFLESCDGAEVDSKTNYCKLNNGSEYWFISSNQCDYLRGTEAECILVDGYSQIENKEEIFSVGEPCMSRKPFKYFVCVG